MKGKKVLALILALLMLAALAACGDNSTPVSGTAAPEAGGNSGAGNSSNAGNNSGSGGNSSTGEPVTFICANRSDPGNYGPFGNASERKMYQNMLFESLLFANSDGEIENVLLKDYESKGNGVYRLYLYDYIHDTEGNPLTASDVAFSFQKALEEGTHASTLSTFDGFEIVDDYTLDMKLVNEKAGDFYSICCAIKIVTEAAWSASGDDMVHNAVGTSPYKLTDFVEGSYVLYEKTNDYWQTDASLVSTRGQANSDYVRWVTVADNSACAVALQNGEIDHAKDVSSSDYSLFMNESMEGIDGYTVAAIPGNMVYALTFNCGPDSVVSSLDLRKAICYAIDTEAIAANLFSFYGRAVGNYINPAYGDYDESLEDLDNYYRFDEAKAAEYLAASGYSGETVRILVSPRGQGKNMGTLIQGFLLNAGINCELLTYEAAIYTSYLYDETGSEWDIALTADQGSTGTEYMWAVLYGDDNTLNDFGSLQHIHDDTLQSLYETMASVDGNSTASLGAFLDYVKENCYQYGTIFFNKFSFAGPRVSQFVVDATGEVVAGACVVNA